MLIWFNSFLALVEKCLAGWGIKQYFQKLEALNRNLRIMTHMNYCGPIVDDEQQHRGHHLQHQSKACHPDQKIVHMFTSGHWNLSKKTHGGKFIIVGMNHVEWWSLPQHTWVQSSSWDSRRVDFQGNLPLLLHVMQCTALKPYVSEASASMRSKSSISRIFSVFEYPLICIARAYCKLKLCSQKFKILQRTKYLRILDLLSISCRLSCKI